MRGPRRKASLSSKKSAEEAPQSSQTDAYAQVQQDLELDEASSDEDSAAIEVSGRFLLELSCAYKAP